MKTIGIAVVPPWREAQHLENLPILCREAGFSDLALMIQCHPESEPLFDKIDEGVERLIQVRERLEADGIGVGILLQTTLDHGERYHPLPQVDFQRIVGHDGVASEACFCPVDSQFQSYMFEAAERFSRGGAKFLLVDDDFRLSNHAPATFGCFCDAHLDMFAEMYGSPLGREQLVAAMGRDGDEAIGVRQSWLNVRERSYLDFARGFRMAIDRVNPGINSGICIAGQSGDIGAAMARALAGKNRPFVRINGAIYMNTSGERFSAAMARHAALRAMVPSDIECLSEADTCPHSRYSVSAAAIRAFIIGTLLVGTDGAKLWISDCQEWYLEETDRYRATLGASTGYFEEVLRSSKDVTWLGPHSFHPHTRPANMKWKPHEGMWSRLYAAPDWAASLFGRFGIPWSATPTDGITVTAGDSVRALSDDEATDLLSRSVLLDASAAHILADRGFGSLTGVEVRTDEVLRINHERYSDDVEIYGRYVGSSLSSGGHGISRLVPMSDDVRIVSSFEALQYYQNRKAIFVAPAVTLYQNKLGGRVAVYAAIPGGGVFASPNDRHKQQLIGVLGWLSMRPLPVWTVDTADVFVRYGRINEGARILAVINTNPDEISPLRLCMPVERPAKAEYLGDSGDWLDVAFDIDGDIVSFDITLTIFRSFIVRIEIE